MERGKRYGMSIASVLTVALLLFSNSVFAVSEEDIRASMQAMNEQLEDMGKAVRIAAVDYITATDEIGQTVYFDDRTKQDGAHFVPSDPRRGGWDDITWLSANVDGAAYGVSLLDTQNAIVNAMYTWDSVECSTIPLTKLPDYGINLGFVKYLAGYGGINGWYADITHAGWLPGSFFDHPWVGGPGASSNIVGVTFTFVWIDTTTGQPTDIDSNGREDVAFREIYYNNNFPWGIGTDWPVDVESIVLHETGHGLSQDHFGALFLTDANGKFHFAPRAVMNAGYTGVQQELTGTDIGGHCSIWGGRPNE